MIRLSLPILVLSGLTLWPSLCSADLAPEPSSVLRTNDCVPKKNCRTQPLHVRLHSNDHGDDDFILAPSQYVTDGKVSIFPGETLVFHFDNATQDAPGNPTFVKATAANPVSVVPPSDAIVQSTPDAKVQHDPKTGENYTVISKGSAYAPTETAKDHLKDQPPGTLIVSLYQIEGKADMVLRIEHNLPKPIKLDAQMLRVSPNASMTPTSTCPMPVVLADMETWPYPIAVITLANFRYVDISAGMTCS